MDLINAIPELGNRTILIGDWSMRLERKGIKVKNIKTKEKLYVKKLTLSKKGDQHEKMV